MSKDIEKPSLKNRLHAWWEGNEVAQPTKKQETAAPAAEPTKAEVKDFEHAKNGKPLWRADRIEINQIMWGKGLINPGKPEYVSSLIKPLAINKTMSIVDLAAGLGGITRYIHRDFGSWMNGFEANSLIAEMGMTQTKEQALVKQAPIHHYNPSNFTVPRRFDVAIIKEFMYLLDDKEAFLEQVLNALKPQGQLMITDYVLDNEGVLFDLTDWISAEPGNMHLIPMNRMVMLLAKQGYDVRVTEDISANHVQAIIEGLNNLKEHLKNVTATDPTREQVLEEAKTWSLRAEALNKGLKLFRIHAISNNKS
ncbi:MAG: class I SAM-dependent methyltransferase [Alphaproteobacteria bacterium]